MLGLSSDLLAIYLQDHLAGATVGVELSRRIARSNRDSALGEALTEIAEEIESDRAALVDVMERLSVGPDRLKLTASWTAEKAGRLKLNGRLRTYSPLSRLEELELLSLGVEGKLALWQTLRRVAGAEPRLSDVDFDALIERARGQRRKLERRRRAAADEAFS